MNKKLFGNASITFLLIVMVLLLYSQFLNRSEVQEDATLPKDLHPLVLEKKETLVKTAADSGISIIVTDGFRSFQEQDSLYQKGRTTDGQIVTHAKAGDSYHNFGLAIDFAILDKQGKALWDTAYDGNGNGKSDWMEVVAIAKELGFQWGGDWEHFKDYPHFEMRFGLTIDDLQRGKRPPQNSLTASQN